MDVKFTQSTDGGITWSAPVTVNDNVDAPSRHSEIRFGLVTCVFRRGR